MARLLFRVLANNESMTRDDPFISRKERLLDSRFTRIMHTKSMEVLAP